MRPGSATARSSPACSTDGEHLLLPTMTLAIPGVAIYSRYQRSLMLDTLNADYVRTARAKGLTEAAAVFKHALRTAMIPVGTLFAFCIAAVFTGATFTETLFGWHGMGEYLITTLIKAGHQRRRRRRRLRRRWSFFVGAVLSEIFVVATRPESAGELMRRGA